MLNYYGKIDEFVHRDKIWWEIVSREVFIIIPKNVYLIKVIMCLCKMDFLDVAISLIFYEAPILQNR